MSAVATVAAGRWLGTAGGSVVMDAGAGVDGAAAAAVAVGGSVGTAGGLVGTVGGSTGAAWAGTGGWSPTFVAPLASVAGSGGVLAPAIDSDAYVVPMVAGVISDGGVETGAEGLDVVTGLDG